MVRFSCALLRNSPGIFRFEFLTAPATYFSCLFLAPFRAWAGQANSDQYKKGSVMTRRFKNSKHTRKKLNERPSRQRWTLQLSTNSGWYCKQFGDPTFQLGSVVNVWNKLVLESGYNSCSGQRFPALESAARTEGRSFQTLKPPLKRSILEIQMRVTNFSHLHSFEERLAYCLLTEHSSARRLAGPGG